MLGILSEPSNLIPPLASDSISGEVSGWLYISLLKYDKNIQVTPYAAESYSVSDDGLRLCFTLRKDLFWEDGTPLTSADVVFTYKLMIDPKTPTAYGSDFKAIKAVNVLDAYSFEVLYEKPYARALQTWMSAVLPKHVLEGQDLRAASAGRKPLGSGQYVLTSWRPGTRIVLTANQNYFEGRPNIEQLVYRVITDTTTMFLELKAGKLDLLSAMTPQQFLSQAKTEAFQKEFVTHKSLAFSYTYLGYNLKSPLFADKRVRKAFAYAIDKQELIKGALLGQGEPAQSPYRPDMWAYNSLLQPVPYDLHKAHLLMKEAGWEKNKKGILHKNGQEFEFTLLVNQGNETRVKTAVILQNQLQKLGIAVKIRTVEWNAFLQHFIYPGFFDAVVLAWTIPQDPDAYDVWHSSRVGGGLNFIHFSNAEVDQLLEEARGTFDQEKRKKLYARFQEILQEEQPYCFLYYPYQLTAIHKRFQGVDPAPAGLTHNFKDWWVPFNDQRYRMQIQ